MKTQKTKVRSHTRRKPKVSAVSTAEFVIPASGLEIHIHPAKVEFIRNGFVHMRMNNGAAGSDAAEEVARMIAASPSARVRNFDVQGHEIAS